MQGYEDAATGSLGRMPSSELEEGTQRRAYHAQSGMPGSGAAGAEFGGHQTRPMAPSIYTGDWSVGVFAALHGCSSGLRSV